MSYVASREATGLCCTEASISRPASRMVSEDAAQGGDAMRGDAGRCTLPVGCDARGDASPCLGWASLRRTGWLEKQRNWTGEFVVAVTWFCRKPGMWRRLSLRSPPTDSAGPCSGHWPCRPSGPRGAVRRRARSCASVVATEPRWPGWGWPGLALTCTQCPELDVGHTTPQHSDENSQENTL